VAITGYSSITRSGRGIPGPSIRRHQSLRYSCEAGDYNGKRYSVGKEDSWGMGWTWMMEEIRSGRVKYGSIGIGWIGVLGCIGRLGGMIHEILELLLLYMILSF
jgi:hypothetical protein